MIHYYDGQGMLIASANVVQPPEVVQANKVAMGAAHVVVADLGCDPLETCYMDGVAKPRPPNPVILEGMWLRRLVIPSTVYLNGTPYTTNKHEVELSFTHPGKKTIRVVALPYYDAVFEVTV